MLAFIKTGPGLFKMLLHTDSPRLNESVSAVEDNKGCREEGEQ